MYLVVDTVSRNVLGECDDLATAKVLFLDLVAAHPAAANEILILTETGASEPVSRDEILTAIEAAVPA